MPANKRAIAGRFDKLSTGTPRSCKKLKMQILNRCFSELLRTRCKQDPGSACCA
jgi:hypothetical protein